MTDPTLRHQAAELLAAIELARAAARRDDQAGTAVISHPLEVRR